MGKAPIQIFDWVYARVIMIFIIIIIMFIIILFVQ